MIVVFLAVQALIFAAWVVLSFSILLGILMRATRWHAFPPPGDQLTALASYLRDPETRFRRVAWVILTAALLLCAITSAFILRPVWL